MRDEPAVRRDGQSQGHATDITAGLLVEIDLVSRSAAKDLGLAPIGNGFELVGVDEGFEGFFALPLAEDEIAAGGVFVFEQVRIDMAGGLAEVFEDAGETFLELFGFAGEDVVVHADGGHGGIVSDVLRRTKSVDESRAW